MLKIGDEITWTFDENSSFEKLKGKKYTAKIAFIDVEERHYGVYAEYGQDLIGFDLVEPSS